MKIDLDPDPEPDHVTGFDRRLLIRSAALLGLGGLAASGLARKASALVPQLPHARANRLLESYCQLSPSQTQGPYWLNLQLLRQERPRIVDAIEEARSHGDLSENAEYHAAKERQGQVEAQIAELEDRVTRAQIIDPASLSGDKVVFGATVTVLDDDDKKQRYQIVGMTEADARQGRISYDSPLGRALIGKQVGEEVEVTVPSGDRFYQVKKIEFI